MKNRIVTISLLLMTIALVVYCAYIFTSDDYYITFFGFNPDRRVMGVITLLAFLIVLFLTVRDINLWYWGIKRRIKLLESIEQELKISNCKADVQNILLTSMLGSNLTTIHVQVIDDETGNRKIISLKEFLEHSYPSEKIITLSND